MREGSQRLIGVGKGSPRHNAGSRGCIGVSHAALVPPFAFSPARSLVAHQTYTGTRRL